MPPGVQRKVDELDARCLTSPLYRDYIVIRVLGESPSIPLGAPGSGQLIISDRVAASPVPMSSTPSPCGSGSSPWQPTESTINLVNDDNRPKSSPMHGEAPTTDLPVRPIASPNPIAEPRRQPVTPDAPKPGTILARDFFYPRSLDGKALIQTGDRTMVFDWREIAG